MRPNKTHVDVGYPDQRELRNQVASPIRVEQLKAREDEERGGDVVAKAVFAGEEIKEFAFVDFAAGFAFGDAVIAEFADDFFVGDGPCHGGYRDGEDE